MVGILDLTPHGIYNKLRKNRKILLNKLRKKNIKNGKQINIYIINYILENLLHPMVERRGVLTSRKYRPKGLSLDLTELIHGYMRVYYLIYLTLFMVMACTIMVKST